MIVLGFLHGELGGLETPVGHDAGAALVIDGEIVAAVEEERFARAKHTSRFPEASIAYCLSAAGIRADEVDRFCVPWSAELDRQNMARAEIELSALLGRHSLRTVVHADPFAALEQRFAIAVPEARRRRLPHHLCHAASAVFCAPFERTAYLVLDAYGEMVSVSTGVARGGRLEPIDQVLLPTSLGVFYADYTHLLGFLGKDDEYKVMGLAAYGDPARFRALFRAQWRATEHGVVQNSDATARAAVLELARFRRLAGAPLDDAHRDIAAALQESLEDQVLHLARVVRERTGEDCLCLAGGVALNSTANGKLARAGLFRDIFIQPAANDAGTPLGAALLECHRHVERPRPAAFSAYLGPAFSAGDIEAALARHAAEIVVSRPADVLGETVRRLRAQQILGWFQGRMEYGPRALGNRSILADPRDPAIRDRINHAVKHRESFRPFAPAVLAEHADACFAMGPVRSSPFMLMTVAARPERRAGFEAAIHRDDTSRIQTVTETGNPRFHALLARFHAETGVPVLLNTSFNVNGEPIVCSPDDAIESFLSTELDAIVLGDAIVERRVLDPAGLHALRPCVQDGVTLRTQIAAPAPGQPPAWHHTVVSRRHLKAELAEDAVAILLACDGQRTGHDLLEQLAPLGDGDRDQTARDLTALLDRLLRLRLIRIVAPPEAA